VLVVVVVVVVTTVVVVVVVTVVIVVAAIIVIQFSLLKCSFNNTAPTVKYKNNCIYNVFVDM